jgi:hypothetical protein
MIERYSGVLQYITTMSSIVITGSHKVAGIISLNKKYTLRHVNA